MFLSLIVLNAPAPGENKDNCLTIVCMIWLKVVSSRYICQQSPIATLGYCDVFIETVK